MSEKSRLIFKRALTRSVITLLIIFTFYYVVNRRAAAPDQLDAGPRIIQYVQNNLQEFNTSGGAGDVSVEPIDIRYTEKNHGAKTYSGTAGLRISTPDTSFVYQIIFTDSSGRFNVIRFEDGVQP